MALDGPTVEPAAIVLPENPTGAYGVSLKLNKMASNKFGQLTEDGIGKQGDIVSSNSKQVGRGVHC